MHLLRVISDNQVNHKSGAAIKEKRASIDDDEMDKQDIRPESSAQDFTLPIRRSKCTNLDVIMQDILEE